jgi:hypothetical protein
MVFYKKNMVFLEYYILKSLPLTCWLPVFLVKASNVAYDTDI